MQVSDESGLDKVGLGKHGESICDFFNLFLMTECQGLMMD